MKRIITTSSVLHIVVFALLTLPVVTSAQTFENPLQFDSLEELLRAILSALILIAFPILVLFMVYSGFLFISAQGNAEKLSKARTVFIWTLIGALIVLGAQALSIAINETVQQIQI